LDLGLGVKVIICTHELVKERGECKKESTNIKTSKYK